jgi:hypothetical protein
MFPNRAIGTIAVLIGLMSLCAVGCGDSPRSQERGDSPVSPQTITLPGPGNPFRPDTEVVFTMPQTGPWSASIITIFSDTVRSYSGAAAAGQTVWIVWDGHDDHGGPEPDGIYFAKVTAGEYLFTKKLLLLWRP